MRKVKMPLLALKRHEKAFATYVEDGLKRLLNSYRCNNAYCEYLRCLMINPNDSSKKRSIVIRNVKDLASVVNAVDLVKVKYHPRGGWAKLEQSLKKLFNYTYRFVKGHNSEKWDSGQYIKMMIEKGLAYCPYCNRHELEAYTTSDGKSHKGPLDHFYDKDRYPYLALSIYNLIPACDSCNHEKLTAQTSLISHSHPFYDDFHELVAFSVLDPLTALYGNQTRCEVELCSKRKKRSSAAEKLASDIELVSRYNAEDGGRVAHDILKKGVRYRGWTINNYRKLAKMKRMSLDEIYVDEFGVKSDGSDINLQPYGKLRNDLMPVV